MLGDEGGHHHAQRRDQHDHGGDGAVEHQHEDECAQNGQHAGEQLGEAHEQAVGELIHIRHHAAEQVAGGVLIQLGQGHSLELLHGVPAQVAGDAEGHVVIAHAQQPLADGGDGEGEDNVAADDPHPGKIHCALANHAVDGVAGQDGDIELGRHAEGSGEQAQRQPAPIGADAPQHPAEGGAVCTLLLLHPASPPCWNWLS